MKKALTCAVRTPNSVSQCRTGCRNVASQCKRRLPGSRPNLCIRRGLSSRRDRGRHDATSERNCARLRVEHVRPHAPCRKRDLVVVCSKQPTPWCAALRKSPVRARHVPGNSDAYRTDAAIFVAREATVPLAGSIARKARTVTKFECKSCRGGMRLRARRVRGDEVSRLEMPPCAGDRLMIGKTTSTVRVTLAPLVVLGHSGPRHKRLVVERPNVRAISPCGSPASRRAIAARRRVDKPRNSDLRARGQSRS